LEPLDVNENYDFDYQQVTFFDEEVDILPGDQFIVHCTYDTTDKEDMTLGGQGSSDEMCIAFLWVYPKPDLFYCVSKIHETAIDDWLNDAYDAGYWDVDWDGATIADLIANGSIESASDVPPYYWKYVGGFWNTSMDGANEFYDKFYDENDTTYSARTSLCWDGAGAERETDTSFEEELGNFTEYCSDSCGCDTTEEEAQSDDEDDNNETYIIIGIVVGVVLLLVVIAIVVVLMRKNKNLKESTETAQHTAGQPSSEIMTTTQTEQKIVADGN